MQGYRLDMTNVEAFEFLKAHIESLKDTEKRVRFMNSLTQALTLPSKKFMKRTQEIWVNVKETENDKG